MADIFRRRDEYRKKKKKERRLLVVSSFSLCFLLILGILLSSFLWPKQQPIVLGSVTYAPIPEEVYTLHKKFCEATGLPTDTQFTTGGQPLFAFYTLQELCREKGTIVRGTVVKKEIYLHNTYHPLNASEPQFSDYEVRSKTTIAVQEVFQGTVTDNKCVITEVGGETELLITEPYTYLYQIGDESFFFISGDDNWAYPFPLIQDGTIRVGSEYLPATFDAPANSCVEFTVEEFSALLRKLCNESKSMK